MRSKYVLVHISLGYDRGDNPRTKISSRNSVQEDVNYINIKSLDASSDIMHDDNILEVDSSVLNKEPLPWDPKYIAKKLSSLDKESEAFSKFGSFISSAELYASKIELYLDRDNLPLPVKEETIREVAENTYNYRNTLSSIEDFPSELEDVVNRITDVMNQLNVVIDKELHNNSTEGSRYLQLARHLEKWTNYVELVTMDWDNYEAFSKKFSADSHNYRF